MEKLSQNLPSSANGHAVEAPSVVRGSGAMANLIRAHDWVTTPIGHIRGWSPAMLTSVNTMLGSPVPSTLFWGTNFTVLYNDAYRDVLGNKHPEALGKPANVVWREAWEAIASDVSAVLEGKGSFTYKEALVPVNRSGSIKDAYWDYNLSPVYELDGSVAAVLGMCHEVTEAVLARRLLLASEDRILSSIGDAVIVTDTESRITRMNPVAEGLTGWKQEDARGVFLEQVFRIINETSRSQVESPAEKVRRVGTVVGLANHTILLRRDGTEVHIDDSAAPIHDDQGSLIGIVLVFRDIRERRTAERVIQQSEERFRTLLELSPVGVAMTDAMTGQILFANDEAGRITGYTREELEGMCSRDFTYKEDQDANDLFYREVQENATAERLVTKRYVRKDGTVIWSQVRAKVIEDVDGKRCVLGTIEDVSERLAAQQKLEDSERTLQEFVDTIPALAWMAKNDGWIFWYNHRWYEYTGTSPAEMEGWGWQSVHDPVTLPSVMERWTNSIRTGEAFEMVFPLKGSDGVFRSFLTRVTPVRDAAGAITRWFGTNTEIDELEQTRAALSAERSRLAAVIENVPVGLLFADAAGRVLGGNPQMDSILRHPILFSRGTDEYQEWISYHPDGRRLESHEYPLARTLDDGGHHRGEYLYQRGDGTQGWVQFSSAPIKDENGKLIGGVAATLDIDERKRAEEALIRTEKLAAVGRLAASIAHEINNPLESVTNILYLLKMKSEGESLEYVSLAERELQRVAAITNQALRFHRQSTRAITTTCQELIGGVLALYEGKLATSKIRVEKRKRAGCPVVCFDGEIRQVLNNLIGNAIDAMHPDGGRLLIRSREGTDWKTGRKGIVLTVADTGVGMSRQTAQRVFEAFYTTKGMGAQVWDSGSQKKSSTVTLVSSPCGAVNEKAAVVQCSRCSFRLRQLLHLPLRRSAFLHRATGGSSSERTATDGKSRVQQMLIEVRGL